MNALPPGFSCKFEEVHVGATKIFWSLQRQTKEKDPAIILVLSDIYEAICNSGKIIASLEMHLTEHYIQKLRFSYVFREPSEVSRV